MKLIAVQELDERVEVVESNESTKAKEEVFELVKRLFHLTSNKKKIWSDMDGRIKLTENRTKQLSVAEKKLKDVRDKLSKDVSDIEKKLTDNIKLLESSLKGGLAS